MTHFRKEVRRVHAQARVATTHSTEMVMSKLLIGVVSTYVIGHAYVWLHVVHHLPHVFG
jgi:hypothetical protein